MNNNITNIIYLGTLYLLSASALYLFGFWDNFNINILEYIAVTDIIKLAIKNLLASVALFFIGYMAQQTLFGRHLQPGGGANTPVGRAIHSCRYLFLSFDVLIIISIYTFVNTPNKWFYLAFCVGVPGGLFLSNMDYFRRLLPNTKTRINVLVILTAIPLLSYAGGNTTGYKIYSGNAKYTVSEKESIFKNFSLNYDALLYIGMMGDHLFLFDKETKKIYIHKTSSEDLLVLIPIKKENKKSHKSQDVSTEKHNNGVKPDGRSQAGSRQSKI